MAGAPIYFYLNDGSDTNNSISSGETSFPTLDYFGWSREGYNFLYWNTASDGSGTTYYADAPIPESLRGGGSCYAIWESATPTVTYYKTSSTDLTSVADAIRTKGGTSASLVYPNGFVSAIEDIPTPSTTAVRFIDYDGTVLYSYSAADFASLSAMPANPSHTGLTAQGWNWTLADAQTYVATNGKLDIGQMYITDDGKTRVYISLVDSTRLSPYLGICPNGTVVVDWGDGTATDTLTGTSLSIVVRAQHTYATTGDYVITLTVSSGTFAIYGASSATNGSYLLTRTNEDNNSQKCYQNAVQKIELGASSSIRDYAFTGCGSLTGITIPSGVTTIGSYAFTSCYSLASITIPSGVTSIGNDMFEFCYSLVSIMLPRSMTYIGQYAFHDCGSLTSITIPSGVTVIHDSTFKDCRSLASITIPSGVTTIQDYVFDNCCSLTSITIPSRVTTIQEYAFNNCYSLTSITIPSRVTSIGNALFNNCYSLTSITIPSGVTSIGKKAFTNCYSLVSITIPSGVTSIGEEAFNTCRSLASITIPSGVTSIGASSFKDCCSLTSITIPSGVTSIGQYAFTDCYSLASITMPSEVTSIGQYAFNTCRSLASITIPSGVTSIGNSSFYGCNGVAEYHLLPTTPPTLGNTNAFSGIPSDCKIYVPAASLSAYQTATNWSTYASYMVGE